MYRPISRGARAGTTRSHLSPPPRHAPPQHRSLPPPLALLWRAIPPHQPPVSPIPFVRRIGGGDQLGRRRIQHHPPVPPRQLHQRRDRGALATHLDDHTLHFALPPRSELDRHVAVG